MIFSSSIKSLLEVPVCWMTGMALAMVALAAETRPSPTSAAPTDARALLPVPSPSRVNPRELPEAFSKATPASLADLKAMEQHVKTLIARVSPAVVAVEVGSGSGSGVVITGDGLVLTAGHVCGAPNRPARFTFPDGRTAEGRTLGVDRENDTGLLRITNKFSWPHVPVGDLTHASVGDWVLALGHPGGFDVKRSLVVRLGRIILLAGEALQTDCTISPGDSGGPVFDMYGRVIAIHSAISGSTAENFHVPITRFIGDWDELARGSWRQEPGPPPRAYVGADGETAAEGCRLITVEQDSPASKAGLKVGDVVLKVDGRDIKASSSFRRWVAEAEPGETLDLEVKRGAQLLSLAVTLDSPPKRH